MDRPPHRRLILIGLVFLAGVALLLIDRPRTPTPKPTLATFTISQRQLIQAQPDQVASKIIEVATPIAEPPPSHDSFHGRVFDAVTRQPIKQFEVQLIRVRREAHTEEQPITRKFKSASGHFTWKNVGEGTWRAAVSAAGYQMFNVGEFQISAGEITRETVMPLLRGFAVRGRVVESSTRAGIAGAHISFRHADEPQNFGRSSTQAKSKEDGSFALDGVPGGNIILTVGAPSHAFRELPIVVDEKTPAQEIALSTGASIAGVVTTTAGLPVEGRVILNGPGAGHIGKTNEAGQFSFKRMPPGRYKLSVDTSAGSATHEFTVMEDEVKQDITLIVGAGRSVRGTLTGGPTEQLQSAQIMLRSESGGAVLTAQPDEQGAYALRGVPAGRAVITVFNAALQLEKNVVVPADRDVTVDIALPTGARLSGRVTQGGKPAANRNVWMSPADKQSGVLYRASTSEDGQYEIEGLPPGDYRLRADEDISRSIAMAGDAVLNIDIPSAQLSARVLDDGGAVPIVGAKVYVRGSAPETARVRVDKQTDDLGQFTLTGIEPGEIVLIVYKPGYELHRETIAYSSPITNRTIALKKSAGVEVRVQPGSRRFPRGFTITQSFPGNDHVVDLWIPIDRDGVCHVPSALAGTTFQIGRFSGAPIVIEKWDGQPFELR